MVHNYENLEVWKRSLELSLSVYQDLKTCKDYGLKDQMQRAAVSIPSNIAEGSQRSSNKDFIRFLNISKGSAAELNTQILIAYRLHYITLDQFNKLNSELKQVLKMLSGLINKLH